MPPIRSEVRTWDPRAPRATIFQHLAGLPYHRTTRNFSEETGIACQQWQAILVQDLQHAKVRMLHVPRLSYPYAVMLLQQPRIVASDLQRRDGQKLDADAGCTVVKSNAAAPRNTTAANLSFRRQLIIFVSLLFMLPPFGIACGAG
jgi:hypothetical protein